MCRLKQQHVADTHAAKNEAYSYDASSFCTPCFIERSSRFPSCSEDEKRGEYLLRWL